MSPDYLWLVVAWTLGFCFATSMDGHLRSVDGRLPPSEEELKGAAFLWMFIVVVILIGGCTA